MTARERLQQLAPSREVAVGLGHGSPLAVVVVWVLDTYVLPAPMPGVVAGAVGALVTSAALYVREWLRRFRK